MDEAQIQLHRHRCNVLLVQALHDDDHGRRRDVVEAVGDALAEDADGGLALGVALGCSVECGSSTLTRSPRPPVIELKGRASLKPLPVFSNFPLAFWSPRSFSGHAAWYWSLSIRRRSFRLSRRTFGWL
ncbi:hypothetical protein [Xanthomonas arboricola]|uniref:hypothetical protein n=1 Tax=Xanthomonas arboricola TaxID=56448 RepID=UPI002B304F16|nr:hypothetical protein X12_001581 [Xanthomonas arboricola]